MTEKQDTSQADERQKLTAEQVREQHEPVAAWLKRKGATDPENMAGNVIAIMATKYLGTPIEHSVWALAKDIARRELSSQKKTNKKGVPRDRREQATDAPDLEAQAGGGVEVTRSGSGDPEARLRQRDADALLIPYADRVGIDVEEARERVEEKIVVHERGRLSRPGRYYQEEDGERWQATRRKSAEDFESRWGQPWAPAAASLVGADITGAQRAHDDSEVQEEKIAKRVLGALRRALDEASVTAHRQSDDNNVVRGDAMDTLARYKSEIDKLKEAISAPRKLAGARITIAGREFHGLAGEFVIHELQESALRRFVLRALTTPEFLHGLGCTQCTQRPTVNELADIWILGGGQADTSDSTWLQQKDGLTVADARETVRKKVLAAVVAAESEGHAPLIRRLDGIMPDRGGSSE